MGYEKIRRTPVFDNRALQFHDFSSDTGIIPFVIVIDCTSTSESAFTYALKEDVRVVDFQYIATVAPSVTESVQVLDNGDNAISDKLAVSADKELVRAGEIDDDNWDESDGNNLKIDQTASSMAGWAFVTVIPKKS